MNILEEFYFGNIDPNTQSFDSNSRYGQAMQIIADREEKLLVALKGEEKQLFLDFCNAWSEINGSTAVSKFIIGFKLGAQFTAESLKEDWENEL
jgi:hypothetical protein